MDMGWILILFIWLVAPFAQLGIIIYLLVLTDKYKTDPGTGAGRVKGAGLCPPGRCPWNRGEGPSSLKRGFLPPAGSAMADCRKTGRDMESQGNRVGRET